MKKILSILLSAAMVLGVMSCITFSLSFTATAGETPGPGEVFEDYVPIGTPITNAAEFAAMDPEKDYYLANDISISATYSHIVETVETDFQGTFDGNGHKIATTVPLFNQFRGFAKNLTITGSITSGAQYVGAVANKAVLHCTFRNIVNKANITNTQPNSVSGAVVIASIGGIVGYAGSWASTFVDCVNEGDITGPVQSGGICGESQRAGNTFIRCTNKGNITSTSDITLAAAGGIVGYNGTAPVMIEGCVNYGNITGCYRTGGIIGDARKSATVRNSVNNGNVTSKTETTGKHAGGIIGYMCDGSTTAAMPALIENCVNNGKVDAFVSGTTSGIAGGMVGYCGANGSKYGPLAINNCLNTGEITSGSQTGGFIGYVYGSAKNSYFDIENSVNTGYINAGTWGSQFVGYSNTGVSVIKNAVGAGTMNTSTTYRCIFGVSSSNATTCTIQDIVLVDGGATTWFTYSTGTEANQRALSVLLDDATRNVTREAALTQTIIDGLNTRAAGAVEFLLDGETGAVSVKEPEVIVCDAAVTTAGGDTTQYETLNDAIAAAENGDTVKLLRDVTNQLSVSVDKSEKTFTIDGQNHTFNFTGVRNFAMDFTGSGMNVTVKNLTVEGKNGGVILVPMFDGAENKSVFTMENCTVTANSGYGFCTYRCWDINISESVINGSTTGFSVSANYGGGDAMGGFNNIEVVDSEINGGSSYGAYFRSSSTVELTGTKITQNADSGNHAIQIVTATDDTVRTTLTLNDCEIVASNEHYCVLANPNNTVNINGGTYTSSNSRATINIGGTGADGTITGGTFINNGTTDGKSAVVLTYDNSTEGATTANVNIEGGTFIYTGENAGSVVRTVPTNEDEPGSANISGGVFITSGTGPVINNPLAESQVSITGGMFVNKGTATVPVLTNVGAGTASISFPAGQKAYIYGFSLTANAGASIRLNATGDESGLRFTTSMSKSQFDALVAEYGAENVRIGTIITPTAYVTGAGACTKEALEAYKTAQSIGNVAYLSVAANSANFYKTEGDTVTFAGSVKAIKTANYGLAFSAIGFVDVTIGEETYTVYANYTEADCSRSVKAVAIAALADTSVTYSAADLAILNAYAGN